MSPRAAPVPPSIAAIVVAMVAVPAFAVAVGIVPLVSIGGERAYWVTVAGAAVTCVATIRVSKRIGAGRILGAAILLAAFLTPLIAFDLAQKTLLATRGEEATAVVEQRWAGGGRTATTYICTLTHLDGAPIQPRIVARGWLTLVDDGECKDLRSGQNVEVVYDPEGKVPPRIGELDPNPVALLSGGVLAALILLAGIQGRSSQLPTDS